MEKRECPYCRTELDAQKSWYLLKWCKGEEEKREQYTELMKFLRQFEYVSGERKKERFDRVWSHYNFLSMDELLFSPEDFILLPEEVQRLIDYIEHLGGQDRVMQHAYLGVEEESDFIPRSLIKTPSILDTEPIQDTKEDKAKTAYFYKKKNPQDEFDFQGDISVGIQDHVTARIRRVCFHCHNLTPDDLYRYPMIKVYLMATPESGKTCMLFSMYLNQDKFHEKNQHRMCWESIQDINVDPYFEKFYHEMQEYKVRKSTSPTKIQFVPPLLMKVTYKKDDENSITMIVALFDNGGELFLGNESKIAREHAELFNQKIKGMDALLCIVNTERSELERDKYGKQLSREELQIIREKCYVLSSEEQERIEDDILRNEESVEMILNDYICECVQEIDVSQQIEQEFHEIQGKEIAESSTRIIENLQLRLGGEQEMKDIIKEKYFALIISKTDRLVYSQMFEEYERPLFFEDQMDYFSDQERQRKLERDRKMKEWQRKGILVQYNLKNFRERNYHFVAAHVQSNKGICPIRIEEPLIGIVEDFVRRKG